MDSHALSHTWAVVTGASSGIGLVFCRQLAAMGQNLLMISIDHDQLQQCAQAVSHEFDVETRTLCIDLAEPDAPQAVEIAVKSLPQAPKVLINNAGIFDFEEVSLLSPMRIDTYIGLHIRTFTQISRSIGAIMAHNPSGAYMLNMSSMSCWMPMPGIAMYSATKAYIRAFSRAFRIEMLDRGVSVTVACPGGIATSLFGLPERLRRLGVAIGVLATPEKFVDKAIKKMLKRRPQYINGWLNRLAIVAVGSTPEWARRKIKTHILAKYHSGHD